MHLCWVVAGIADAIEPGSLQMDYPEAAGAIIGQHGFNLFWIGLVTLICAFFVWKGNRHAIFLAAITGGLADLGYFLFMDLDKHRIIASIDPDNKNSIRLIEGLGFSKEAHFVESISIDGTWVDNCIYALLEKDWEPANEE